MQRYRKSSSMKPFSYSNESRRINQVDPRLVPRSSFYLHQSIRIQKGLRRDFWNERSPRYSHRDLSFYSHVTRSRIRLRTCARDSINCATRHRHVMRSHPPRCHWARAALIIASANKSECWRDNETVRNRCSPLNARGISRFCASVGLFAVLRMRMRCFLWSLIFIYGVILGSSLTLDPLVMVLQE